MHPPEPDISSERWRGGVDERLRGTETHLAEQSLRINGVDRDSRERDREQDHEIDDLKVEVATLKTKVAIWALIGAIAGSGIATFIAGLALK